MGILSLTDGPYLGPCMISNSVLNNFTKCLSLVHCLLQSSGKHELNGCSLSDWYNYDFPLHRRGDGKKCQTLLLHPCDEGSRWKLFSCQPPDDLQGLNLAIIL